MFVLIVKVDVTVDLDDAAIRSIAVAWPNLRVFLLLEITTGDMPKVTLGGLIPLAAACPRLEQLTLQVNATRVPNFAQTGNIIPANNLYRLNVCTSPVTDESHDRLAIFISFIFPSLPLLTWAGDERSQVLLSMGNQYIRCWRQVDRVLQPLLFAHPRP